MVVGYAPVPSASSSVYGYYILANTTGSYINIGQQGSGEAGGTAQTGTNLIGSGQTMTMSFAVPISGWTWNV